MRTKLMASRVKTRSSEISSASPCCSKKGNGFSSGPPGTIQWILSRKCWKESWIVSAPPWMRPLTDSFNVLLPQWALLLKLELQPLKRNFKVPRCRSTWGTTFRLSWVKLDGMQSKSSHAFAKFSCSSRARSQLYYFVLSGVPEKEVRKEPVHTVVEAWKKLGVNVHASDLFEVRRLGRLPQDRSRQSQVRSRSLLFKTTSKETNAKILTQARTKSSPDQPRTLYFNEDLRTEEQARPKTLVPVSKELRRRTVQCRLDRGSIVINDRIWSSITMKLGVLWSLTQIRYRRRLPRRLLLLLPNSPSPRLPQLHPPNRGALRRILLPNRTTIRPLPLTWSMNTRNHDHLWKFPN